MHAICEEGKNACLAVGSSESSVLIGNMNEEKSKQTKPDLAASIGIPDNDRPLKTTIFDNHLEYDKIGLQWALITMLALSQELREAVAENSPPVAANYVRNVHKTYERWLLGSPSSAARTAYECAMLFAKNIETCYGLSI